jgi:hypothetical protein
MVDYSKTKIYRIPVGDDNYYGHTTQPLSKRKQWHRGDFKRRPNTKVYKAMIDKGMTDQDFQLVWVEDFPCKSKEEATARERYWIESRGTLNTNIPRIQGQTEREYQRDRMRKYRPLHKEEINESKRASYHTHKERINENRRGNYAKNREEIRQDKWTCPHCGIEIRRTSKSRHMKRRHAELLTKLSV